MLRSKDIRPDVSLLGWVCGRSWNVVVIVLNCLGVVVLRGSLGSLYHGTGVTTTRRAHNVNH